MATIVKIGKGGVLMLDVSEFPEAKNLSIPTLEGDEEDSLLVLPATASTDTMVNDSDAPGDDATEALTGHEERIVELEEAVEALEAIAGPYQVVVEAADVIIGDTEAPIVAYTIPANCNVYCKAFGMCRNPENTDGQGVSEWREVLWRSGAGAVENLTPEPIYEAFEDIVYTMTLTFSATQVVLNGRRENETELEGEFFGRLELLVWPQEA